MRIGARGCSFCIIYQEITWRLRACILFEQLMSRAEANKWFGEVLPAMADSLLRLPLMLEAHYKNADSISSVGSRDKLKTGLRLLKSQEAGVVVLSQVRNHTI